MHTVPFQVFSIEFAARAGASARQWQQQQQQQQQQGSRDGGSSRTDGHGVSCLGDRAVGGDTLDIVHVCSAAVQLCSFGGNAWQRRKQPLFFGGCR